MACPLPKINIRPLVRPLAGSQHPLFTKIGQAAEQLNDTLDKYHDLLCKEVFNSSPLLFDKATFGIPGDASVTLSVTPTYSIGPFTSVPMYATISADTSPLGASLIADLLHIPPNRDPQETPLTIVSVSYGTPVSLEITAHGLLDGQTIRISNIEGVIPGTYQVQVTDPNHIVLLGSTTSGSPTYGDAGTALRTNWSSLFPASLANSKKLVVPDSALDDLPTPVVWPDPPPSRSLVTVSEFVSGGKPSLNKRGRLRLDILQVGSTTSGGFVEINLYLRVTDDSASAVLSA